MMSISRVLLLFILFVNAKGNNLSSRVRIYSALAEIIRPLHQLPLEFTDDDWNHIRSDSITLLGKNVNITLQTITDTKKTLNGTEVYIRSPVLSADKASLRLIKGILIDETNHLVKIQDESIAGQQALYLTVPYEQILYIEQPTKPKHSVNFTYTSTDSHVFVSYLQSSLSWRTQYQLNLNDDQSDLIALANIRNNAKSSVSIDRGELIGGDINLQSQPQYQFDRSYRQSRLVAMKAEPMESNTPTVEQGEEFAGVYVFPIDKPFVVNAKSNYLLPMFHPIVSVERYGSVSTIFSAISSKGKAQRSYRLTSDRYLSRGDCIVREDDYIVGETSFPNLAANDKYEFFLGEDANIIYKETVTLISSTVFNQTASIIKTTLDKEIPVDTIITRTRFLYEILVELQNFKSHSVNIEYEQKDFPSYQLVKLTKPSKYAFIQEGSAIKSNMTLTAKALESYSYVVELVR